MSFLVKCLDLPKNRNECLKIRIYGSGNVWINKTLVGHAIQIPTPHGRLIDGDELERYIEGKGFVIGYKAIDDQKVILEAEV